MKNMKVEGRKETKGGKRKRKKKMTHRKILKKERKQLDKHRIDFGVSKW